MTLDIMNHPLWPILLKQLKLEFYDRDGSAKNPRWRLEVYQPTKELLCLECACVRCGSPINPVRVRNGKGNHAYLAITCPLTKNFGCARSNTAHSAYIIIKDQIEKNAP